MQSYIENARRLKETMDRNQQTADMVEAAGGIRTTLTQSDKLGSDWINYYVNDVLVKQVYVEQENPAGTVDNPIKYNETLKLIPNAFYVYGSERKVWMGKASIMAGWNDDGWEIF